MSGPLFPDSEPGRWILQTIEPACYRIGVGMLTGECRVLL